VLESNPVHETPEDVRALQELLDRSYAQAGSHLRSIITPARRMDAGEVCEALTGMRLLALATAAADGRPIVGPVDGIFHRGAFHFGTDPAALRWRHITVRPEVSATHIPAEELAVTVHGRAVAIDIRAEEGQELRRTLLEVYVPRYGPEFEQFLDGTGGGLAEPGRAPVYARIEPERMFTFRIVGEQ
jgi:hypothetical protein